MEFNSVEPRLSTYLHAKACRNGTPLAGNFELTARCNFDCKMCYVHLTAEEQQRRGRELTADEWLAIAETARSHFAAASRPGAARRCSDQIFAIC